MAKTTSDIILGRLLEWGIGTYFGVSPGLQYAREDIESAGR